MNMGTTRTAATEDINTKRAEAFNVLTRIGIRHQNVLSRSVTSPGVSPNNAEGFYNIQAWPPRYVTVTIHIPSPTSPLQNLERNKFDFSMRIGYGPGSPKYVGVSDHLSGSANEIDERVSTAIELAKRFQNCEELQNFLRGGSGKSA